jgi:hypothetical protein
MRTKLWLEILKKGDYMEHLGRDRRIILIWGLGK